MTLAKAKIVNYDHNCSFIVLATVIMIVNYDHHLFIVQATVAIYFSLAKLKSVNFFFISGAKIVTLNINLSSFFTRILK